MQHMCTALAPVPVPLFLYSAQYFQPASSPMFSSSIHAQSSLCQDNRFPPLVLCNAFQPSSSSCPDPSPPRSSTSTRLTRSKSSTTSTPSSTTWNDKDTGGALGRIGVGGRGVGHKGGPARERVGTGGEGLEQCNIANVKRSVIKRGENGALRRSNSFL